MKRYQNSGVAASTKSSVSRLAIISNLAGSLTNFRGPLIHEMVSQGIVVYAFAPDFDEHSRSAVTALGATPVDCSLSRTGTNAFRDVFDMFRLAFQLRRIRVDSTFAYFAKPVIYGTIAAALARVPRRVAMIEGAGHVFRDEAKTSLKGRTLRLIVSNLYRLALRWSHRTYFLNKDDISLFVREGMVSPKQTLLLDGIGLRLDHYLPTPFPSGQVTFILVARLMKEKGVFDYIEAIRLLRAENVDARFLLVGAFDERVGAVSTKDVEAWVSEGLIEYPGHVSDVRPWISSASVFVLPSYYMEGLPRSTQEAMAMGRPVISTDWVGCRETVEDGVNGYLIPIRNPQLLATAMRRFVNDPKLIPVMGRASRRIAEERFDVHRINAQILDGLSC